MRELLDLESWANAVIVEKASQHRPLPYVNDLRTQAIKRYPDVDPTDAMTLFLNDKFKEKEKMDLDQNKIINSQKRENEKLRRSLSDLGRELSDHEIQAQETDREVERLKDLSAKLRPAGEIAQVAAKASADQVDQMLVKLNALKNKPGLDDAKFKELTDKINTIKSIASDKEIKDVTNALDAMEKKQTVSDVLYNRVSSSLKDTQQELINKEKRFQKSLNKNAQEISKHKNDYKGLRDEVESIKGTSQQIFKDLGEKTTELDDKIKNIDKHYNEISSMYNDRLSKFDGYEKYLQNTINNIEQAKQQIEYNLELLSSLGKEDQALDAISNAQASATRTTKPKFDPEFEKEIYDEPTDELPLDVPDEDIPDEELQNLREDVKVTGDQYSLEEKDWLETYLPKFVRLYQKLYPRDIGILVDEETLVRMVEEYMHLMYMYHAIISNKIVREKFEILHKKLVLDYKAKHAQRKLFATESIIKTYSNMLDDLTKISY